VAPVLPKRPPAEPLCQFEPNSPVESKLCIDRTKKRRARRWRRLARPLMRSADPREAGAAPRGAPKLAHDS